jgi:hypothetical protein
MTTELKRWIYTFDGVDADFFFLDAVSVDFPDVEKNLNALEACAAALREAMPFLDEPSPMTEECLHAIKAGEAALQTLDALRNL